jgi:hypothetical protein
VLFNEQQQDIEHLRGERNQLSLAAEHALQGVNAKWTELVNGVGCWAIATCSLFENYLRNSEDFSPGGN